jgi:hypothetical protein
VVDEWSIGLRIVDVDVDTESESEGGGSGEAGAAEGAAEGAASEEESDDEENRGRGGEHPYHGVCYHRTQRCWGAELNANGVRKSKYGFKTAKAAALAWDELANRRGRTDLNFGGTTKYKGEDAAKRQRTQPATRQPGGPSALAPKRRRRARSNRHRPRATLDSQRPAVMRRARGGHRRRCRLSHPLQSTRPGGAILKPGRSSPWMGVGV